MDITLYSVQNNTNPATWLGKPDGISLSASNGIHGSPNINFFYKMLGIDYYMLGQGKKIDVQE